MQLLESGLHWRHSACERQGHDRKRRHRGARRGFCGPRTAAEGGRPLAGLKVAQEVSYEQTKHFAGPPGVLPARGSARCSTAQNANGTPLAVRVR